MADYTESYNTILTQMSAFQTAPPTLAQIQVIFAAIAVILTTPFLNDPKCKYKDDAVEVLSMGKIQRIFSLNCKSELIE